MLRFLPIICLTDRVLQTIRRSRSSAMVTACLVSPTGSCTLWRRSISSELLRSTDPVRLFTLMILLPPSDHKTATKVGAIVAGQTSVKAPEIAAFEKHLPDDVHIVSVHSLHGPTVSPLGQPLVSFDFICLRRLLLTTSQVLIQHRAPDWALHLVESILRPLKSRYVYLSWKEHDMVTANTQAVTHAAFLR